VKTSHDCPQCRELGKIWDEHPGRARHLTQQTGYVLAAELRACGVDLSFTPVLDVDHGQSCIIGDRAFHRKPQAIADLAHSLILGLKAGGMAAVGKHFPGHGYIKQILTLKYQWITALTPISKWMIWFHSGK